MDEYLERDLSLLESDKTNHKENQVSRAGEIDKHPLGLAPALSPWRAQGNFRRFGNDMASEYMQENLHGCSSERDNWFGYIRNFQIQMLVHEFQVWHKLALINE